MCLFSLNIPIQGRPLNIESLANLINGIVLIVVERLCQGDFFRCIEGLCFWSAAYSSSGSGFCQACFGSLSDQITFKLGKRGKDIENESTIAGCGINTLREALKADLSLVEIGNGFNQVLERTP